MNTLPDFILAGAAKGGTTSLSRYLKQHPDVYFPEHKEPYFFSFDGEVKQAADPGFRKLIIDQPDKYSALFAPAAPGQILGEASTSYLYTHQISVPKIQRDYRAANRPPPRMIAILRNPVDRAFSHYVYLRQNGVEPLAFEEAIRPENVKRRLHLRYWDFDYVDYGRYFEQVRHFKSAFPEMRFFLFEDLLNDPQALVRELLEFLELKPARIDTGYVSNPSGEPLNKAAVHMLIGDTWLKSLTRRLVPQASWDMMRRVRDGVLQRVLRPVSLPEATRDALRELYREDNMRLQDLLGRDLSRWM